MLQEFLTAHRDEIIARCRAKVADRGFPSEAKGRLLRGVPLFLEQLVQNLGAAPISGVQMGLSTAAYGRELERLGFTVDQVVHLYGNVGESITDLAVDLKVLIPSDDFGVLNRCIDDAIASAVVGFGGERDKDLSEQEDMRGDERMARFVDQQEILLNKAVAALGVIMAGSAGIGGRTGYVLAHSLEELRALSDRALADLRMTAHTRDAGPTLPKVMVVEDDQDCREILAEFLRIWGYEVESAVNGRDALEKLHDTNHPPPSVILLDLMMPEMNGWEFRKEQIADPKLVGIPVVIVSAAREVQASEDRSLDVNDHLGKPVDFDQLGSVLTKLFASGLSPN